MPDPRPSPVLVVQTAFLGDVVLTTPLLTIDKNFEVRPNGALSYEASKDGKTWTFHLDPKLTWSDGNPVTAPGAFRSMRGAGGAWLTSDQPPLSPGRHAGRSRSTNCSTMSGTSCRREGATKASFTAFNPSWFPCAMVGHGR